MDVRPSTKMTLTNRPPTSIPRVSLLGLVAMDMIVSAYLATTWRPDYFCPCQNKRGIRRWGLCVLKEEPSGDWGHLKQSLLAGPQVVYSDDLPLPPLPANQHSDHCLPLTTTLDYGAIVPGRPSVGGTSLLSPPAAGRKGNCLGGQAARLEMGLSERGASSSRV